MKLQHLLLVIVSTAGLLGCQVGRESDRVPSGDYADTVLGNARIYTVDVYRPWAEAVAVRDGEVVYVGDKSGASAYVGPDTTRYDLKGKLVLPGLIDGHTHPGMVGLSHGELLLPDVESKEELLSAIARLVAENPDTPVLRAGYWANELFDEDGPHKADLDRIVSDRPILLSDYWGHSFWVNSRALELGRVDRNTPDPIPGLAFYKRDAAGEATGWITESAASAFVGKFNKPTEATKEHVLRFLNFLSDRGVTTLLDAGNFGPDDEIYAIIARLEQEGRLPVRYHGSYTLFLPDQLPGAIKELKQLRRTYSSERIRINTIKLFLDGVLEIRTASVLEPYLDDPDNRGNLLLTQDQIRDLILELHEEKIDLHVHTVGGHAIKSTLNAVEEARGDLGVSLDTRVTLCHLEAMDDADINRFKDLGVVANFTPHWHGGDNSALLPIVGDRALNMMRAQPLLSDGAVVTFSSDITVESEYTSERANPFVGMQIGHNKQDFEGGADAPLRPPQSERLSLENLVRGYTINAAYQLRLDDRLGSIEVGKIADLIVLDQNLFEVDRHEIHKIRPEAVFMAGELIRGGVE